MEQVVLTMWLLGMGGLIFLMQAGFFMLEGGQVKSKNVGNSMMKMVGHLGVGTFAFFVIGYAIKQYGFPFFKMPNGWHSPMAFIYNGPQSVSFFVSLVFALVSCAIPSGAFAERIRFRAYLLFAVLYVGIIYPVFAFILWNGFLAKLGVQDYAGSLGVHAVGGIIGLVGAKMLGPRRKEEISGFHNVPLMGMGALLLMFCWFGFNLGSVPSYRNMAADLPWVAMTTVLAMAGGIVGAMFLTWKGGKPDMVVTPNGGLAGAVAVCSGAHLVHPLFAFAMGAVAGAAIPMISKLIKRAKIDDPCDVGPVHAFPGLLGGAFAGLWAPFIPNGFHGYTLHLGAQLLATVITAAYALVAGYLVFKLIDWAVRIRVAEITEIQGMDVVVHGVSSYPEWTASPTQGGH